MNLRADTNAAPRVAMLTPKEAERRFDWARRHGRPQWLWPEVEVARWDASLDRIEGVVRQVMTGGPPPHLAGDTRALSVACYTSGLGPLLGFWSETGRIAACTPLRAMLTSHLQHNRSRMERMTAHAAELAQALAMKGIRPVLLKGMHTAHAYFPEPGTRPLSDIDVLIDPSDEPEASRILARLGYGLEREAQGPPPQRCWRVPGTPLLPRSLDLLHEDDPWALDLQHSLDRAFGIRLFHLDRVARRAETEPWPASSDADVLGQPLLLLHLAGHASGGFSSLTLLRLVELAMVIRRDVRAQPALWDSFMTMATEIGAAGFAYPALRLCEDLVPGTVPERVLATCGRGAPDAVRRVVGTFTPARAHRVRRYSFRERLMWASGWLETLRLIVHDALLPGNSMADMIKIYRMRFWLLLRGRLTR